MAPRGYADFTVQHYIAHAGVAELSEETFIMHTRKAATEKAAIMAFSLCLNIYYQGIKDLSFWSKTSCLHLKFGQLSTVTKRSNFSWRQLALSCRSNDY